MKKKILLALMVAAIGVLAFGVVSVSAAAYGNLTYEISNGEVTITDCDTSASGDLVIPATIDDYPVTSIGDSAFSYCSSLTSITIPDNVTSIGNGVFYGCTKLQRIDVNIDNPTYCSTSDGVLMNKDKTELITYPQGKTNTNYVISNSVTSIGDYAFYNCYRLTSIIIPDSVISIGECAFYYCASLKSITIGNSVTSIDNGTFYGCSGLTSITIPDSVTSIGNSVFYGCAKLQRIDVNIDNPTYCSTTDGVLLNKNKTELIAYPQGKTNTNYVIPDSVISIDDWAFCACDSLASITIPDSVTSIGDYAFSSCGSFTNITIPDSVTSIGDYAFDYCTNLTTITIGNSVTSVGEYTFYGCRSLTSIIMGNSVISIGNWAFFNCASITDVYYKGTEEEWNSISIGSNNEKLTRATRHYIKPITETTLSNNDKTFTITPVNVDNGKTVILALYNGDTFVEMQKAVYAGEAIPFTTTKTYTKAKVMVWDDIESLKSVCEIENVK